MKILIIFCVQLIFAFGLIRAHRIPDDGPRPDYSDVIRRSVESVEKSDIIRQPSPEPIQKRAAYFYRPWNNRKGYWLVGLALYFILFQNSGLYSYLALSIRVNQ